MTKNSESLTRTQKKWLVMAVMLVLMMIGWALRLHRISEDSFWFDELFTLRYASYPLLDLPEAMKRQAQPILAMIPFHLALMIERNELILRLPAALSGIVGIALTYRLLQDLLTPLEGLLAATMMTISAFSVRYGQEARAYTLLMILSLFSFRYLIIALRTNNKWQWIGFCCSLSLALYTHYFALFVVAIEGLYAAAILTAEIWQDARSKSRKWPRLKSKVYAFLLSIGAFILTYLPWWPIMRVNFFERQLAKETSASGLTLSPQLVTNQYAEMGTGTGWGLWVLLVLAAIGVFSTIQKRQWKLLLAYGLWFSIPLGILAIATPRKLLPRYLIFTTPLYYGMIATGIVALSTLLFRQWRQAPRWIISALSALILVAVFVAPSTPQLKAYYDEEKMDIRGTAWFLVHNVPPGQVISAPSYDHYLVLYQPSLEAYFQPSLSLEAVQSLYAKNDRLWFVQGWGQRVNIDPDGSMTAWVNDLPAVVIEFYDIKVLYLGKDVALNTLIEESQEFDLPEGARLTQRE